MRKYPDSVDHASTAFPAALGLRCLVLLTLALTAPLTRADIIYGETSDVDLREDSTVLTSTASTLAPGASGSSPAMDRSSVLVFKLPSLGAVADPFTTAILRFNLESVTGTPPSVDLYGLGRRASATVLIDDYYGKTTTVDPTDATKLQDNILIPGSAIGPISTSLSGGTALCDYLNTQYAGGAGADQYVFLRLSSDSASTSVARYTVTAADSGSAGPPDTRPQIIYNESPVLVPRPFIWVRDSEKAGILDKITNNSWATNVFNGMVSRVAADVASHQSNPDTFLRQLPVEWTLSPAKFKTIPAFSESSVRSPTEAKFNDGVDCAVLYYLTGDAKYARCAADILHNAVKTLAVVTPSTSTSNGGWIFQSDFLKEARVSGTQLPVIYDFLYSYLQANQVYDVQTAGMVDFDFTVAQGVFRTLYQLARDHGQKESNWSALMATTMLNNLLALDDDSERAASLQVYLTTGSSKQASLSYDYRNYTQEGNVWPESLQYASAVGNIRSTHMVLLERYDPSLNLFGAYPNLPLSLPRISYMRYPNGEQISFGDGRRAGTNGPFFIYELVYQHALARGRTDLTSFFGSLINGGVAEGDYNRSALEGYNTLGQQNEPLQLLWQAPVIAEPSVSPELPRTDTLPFAGIALQRNPAPTANSTYGLMCFVGGAGHVHSHASGMSMEIFGMGQVMGAKSGRTTYGDADNENHYRLFAANNTVIVNGASRGEGGWNGLDINTVKVVAMEPQPFATAVSPDFSFTCSSFADNKGTLAEATQQRTMSIVRTSPTSGFYVDVFRSKSTVTNRTATTLSGDVTDQYHDYIYRNFGETAVDLRADGVTLPLASQPNRFQNDIGGAIDQPGWRYFTNTVVSYPTSASVRAQFVATVSGTARYMDMHMPAVANREYAKVSSPAIVDAPSPYDDMEAPTLVVRQTGEAWNKAFAAVYEPHYGSTGGTVQNVTQLLKNGVVVGMKIESTVAGNNLTHYVIANPNDGETYTDSSIGLSFTGRFGVAADNGDGTTTLYLGAGSAMSYQENSVATVSGTNSQAEVRFAPGQTPVVSANAPVDVVAAPLPVLGWVPTAGGTDYVWTDTANWNPQIVPSVEGETALMNNDITGDQTVSVNTPITLGELSVGDSNGSQTTLLQKNTNGAFLFDQTDLGMAYLTRSAGGTGNVTLNNDLNITLNDHLTVRLAGGSASSTVEIAGTISGSGKDLTKEGESLTLILSGANNYSGATRIVSGILELDHRQAIQNSTLDTLGSVPGDATNGLKTTRSSLTFGGLSGDKDLASVFTTTSGAYSGLTALTLNPGSGAALVYSGVIADGSLGMSLIKTGLGTQTLTGENTYTGDTSLSANSGTLEIGGAGKLGGGTYPGAIDIGGGSTFKFASSATQTLSGAISGSGAVIKTTGTSTLTLSGSNSAFTGSVTINAGTLGVGHLDALSGAASIAMSGETTLRPDVVNAVIAAPITVGDTGTTVTFNAPSIAGDGGTSPVPFTLGGVISGAGSVTFSGIQNTNAYGTIYLNAASTYAGSTLVTCSGSNTEIFLRLGIANALPATTVLTLDGGNGTGSGRFCDLNLNGHDQTLAGLTNVTGRNLRSQRVNNTSSTPATLTINDSGSRTYSGQLGAGGSNFSLTKSGIGVFSLTGSLSYEGDTTVTGGTLGLGSANPNNDDSAITIASGTKLKLAFVGTDTVAKLTINGVQQPNGVYGHTDSGADNGGQGIGFFDTWFEADTGTLTVFSAYSSWAATHAGGQAADLDWDNDGVDNGVEYFMNAAPGFTLNPVLDGTRTISWPNGGNIPSSGYGTQFLVQTSPDLADWADVPAGDLTTNTDGPGGSLAYTLTHPAPHFVRLKVVP